MPKRYKTRTELARDALEVQDACNLSGVIHAWAEMNSYLIYEEALDQESLRNHPIQALMLSKVVSLMGVKADSIGSVWKGARDTENYRDLFSRAYEWAQDQIKKGD